MLNVRDLRTPVYLADVNAFTENLKSFREGLKVYYPNCNVGYSYKTNYYLPFRFAVNHLGAYTEIVSPKEYRLAKELGVSDSNIIYNGVLPDFTNKLRVALAGGIVNLDNLTEYLAFYEFCKVRNIPLNIGIRLNFDIGNSMLSRFGIDVESEDFKTILHLPKNGLNINSIHCHFSAARELKFFEKRLTEMVKYARLFDAKIIDIGGNKYGKMEPEFMKQFGNSIPTISDYARVLGTIMAKSFPEKDVMLITEDGTLNVSNAMHLVATIINVKKIQGTTFITVDAKKEDIRDSVSTTSPAYAHYGKDENFVEHAHVMGCSCRESDFIIRDYSGYANIGDKIVIKNIGAYSYNNANGFIVDGCHDVENIENISFSN